MQYTAQGRPGPGSVREMGSASLAAVDDGIDTRSLVLRPRTSMLAQLLLGHGWLPHPKQEGEVDAPLSQPRHKVQVVGAVEEVGVEDDATVLLVRDLNSTHTGALACQPIVHLEGIGVDVSEAPVARSLPVVDNHASRLGVAVEFVCSNPAVAVDRGVVAMNVDARLAGVVLVRPRHIQRVVLKHQRQRSAQVVRDLSPSTPCTPAAGWQVREQTHKGKKACTHAGLEGCSQRKHRPPHLHDEP